jgi:hypothetical protein
VAVHQPNYFPWIGYFHKLAAADTFVLLDNVEFQRGNASSVTNRTIIKTSQGIQKMTVPVLRSGSSHLVQDIHIDQRQAWKRKHLGALTAAYGRAPAFDEIFPVVAATIEAAGESLAALNRESIGLVCRLLDLDRPILVASSLGLTATEKNERLVEICAKVGATIYLSGRGARSYNDEDLFRSHGISLEYSHFTSTAYAQLHGDFVPNLSILDALFSCGAGARRLLGKRR